MDNISLSKVGVSLSGCVIPENHVRRTAELNEKLWQLLGDSETAICVNTHYCVHGRKQRFVGKFVFRTD